MVIYKQVFNDTIEYAYFMQVFMYSFDYSLYLAALI